MVHEMGEGFGWMTHCIAMFETQVISGLVYSRLWWWFTAGIVGCDCSKGSE